MTDQAHAAANHKIWVQASAKIKELSDQKKLAKSQLEQWIGLYISVYYDEHWLGHLTDSSKLLSAYWTLPWTAKSPARLLSLKQSDNYYQNLVTHFITNVGKDWEDRIYNVQNNELNQFELDKILVLNGGRAMQLFHMQWNRITQQNGKDAEVVPLWHGTDYNNMHNIFMNGYDYNLSTRELNGKGIYMAKYASYSISGRYMKSSYVAQDDEFYSKGDNVRALLLNLCTIGITGNASKNVGKSAGLNTVYAWPKQDNGRSVNSMIAGVERDTMYVFGETADMQCLPICAYVFKKK